jgi:glycosyltransferase involved in cell wall biosynthesis
MILNRAYYSIKPLLPWQVRMSMRRAWAKRMRRRHPDTWPIDPRAGVTPPNWPGWPEGKRFAFVLTHDVEATKGLERIDSMTDLESSYGFRSSINLVPESEYRVSQELPKRLQEKGFEVGVHGLKHDGKLFRSLAGFARDAAQINEYARRWGAVGFRSPLMQHNLAWQHLLDVEYDSSTFDTDPFEPEPDGVRTIFPFWVARQGGEGYVELPYTLVQDFNLFTVLGEKNIETWKLKLDWIAERGGMALLNTHPDYMCFSGKPTREEYPVALYEEFLNYAREKYSDQYWHALPREVGRHYTASLKPENRNTRKRVCMLSYSFYNSDNRVRRYAETLAKRGDLVEVVAICGSKTPVGKTELAGVDVTYLQQRERDERGKWSFAAKLSRFLTVSAIYITKRYNSARYDLVHVHNMPDFLVFASYFPRLRGAAVILDIHDLVPELFSNKFGGNDGSFFARLLRWIEKVSMAFADHVIVSNHIWRNKLVTRSVSANKCSVVLNNVDTSVFFRRPRLRPEKDGKFVLMFPGSFQWHQGLEIAIEAMSHLKDRAPQAELHLYGGGGDFGTEDRLARLAKRLGVEDRVKFGGAVSMDLIPELVADADLGIVPKRADSFGNEAYSTKIMEFMSQGVPVLAANTKIDTFYFSSNEVRFFTSGDSRAMADAIVELIDNEDLRRKLIKGGLKYVQRHSWDRKRAEYLDLVDRLTSEAAGSQLAVARSNGASVPVRSTVLEKPADGAS